MTIKAELERKKKEDVEKKGEVFFHPEFAKLEVWFQKLLDAYNGGLQVTGKEAYLHTHKRENGEDLAWRRRRTVYYNYGLMITEIYAAILTSIPPNVSGSDGKTVSPEVAEFQRDVDLQGTSMGDFFRDDVIPLAMVHGSVGVIMDLPAIPGAGVIETDSDGNPIGGPEGYLKQKYYLSLQDEIAAGHRPYARPVYMTDIVNWQMRDRENFDWVLIRERVRTNPDPFEKMADDYEEYIYWDAHEWRRIDSNAVVLAVGENKCGEVPLMLVRPSKSKLYELYGATWLAEILELCLKIYNFDSLLDEYYYRQCFSVLAYPGDLKVTKIGTHNVLPYPKDASPPSFLTPPSGPADSLEGKIYKLIREIYRIACLPYATDSKAPETGISKQWDWVQLTQRLKGLAGVMARAESRMYRLYGKWMGNEWEIESSWPREYIVESVEEIVASAERSRTMPIGLMAKTLIHQKAARKLLPDASASNLKTIDKEVMEAVKQDIPFSVTDAGELTEEEPEVVETEEPETEEE